MTISATGYSVASLTELKNLTDLPGVGLGLFYKLFVFGEGREYYYDPAASSGGVTPVGGIGRWFPATRQILLSDITYYVRTDGSDSNFGLTNTAGGAFLTIAKAINAITDAIAFTSARTGTIQLGDGTYSITSTINLRQQVGDGRIILKGNTSNPSNVIISGNVSGYCFRADAGVNNWTLQDFQISNSAGGAIQAVNGASISFQNIVFGTCTTEHIFARTKAIITQSGNYSMTSGAATHIRCTDASVNATGFTVTLTGTPNFSNVYLSASATGYVNIAATTFTGSATGTRYLVASNAVIDTNGGAASYLPGTVNGTPQTGGQYI